LIKRRRLPRIFFGWWTALTGGILLLWGMGYYSYGFSALLKPISADLGLSRAQSSVPASIGRFEGGFEAPLSGWLTDRYGPKWIALFGVSVVGLGLVLMSFINSIWAFYVVWGIMVGTGINLGFQMPITTAINNWFVKKRGKALSLQMVLAGLSGVLVLPLIAWFIETYDWRTACFIGGLVMWGVGLPLSWFCLKRYRPEYYGLLPDGATVKEGGTADKRLLEKGVEYAAEVEEEEFTLRQAWKTSSFWLLVTAGAVNGLAMGAFQIHCIPFLTDIGIDPVKAASMMSIYVLCSLPTRLAGGLIGDRVKKNHMRFLISGAYVLQAVGFAAYLLHQTGYGNQHGFNHHADGALLRAEGYRLYPGGLNDVTDSIWHSRPYLRRLGI
jgi:sugar phosphate permease